MTWIRNVIADLEMLSPEQRALPSRGPTLGRPTIRMHLGIIPETVLGLYGSPRRRTLETEVITLFLTAHSSHIAAAGIVRTGQEGTAQCQWKFLFHSAPDSVAARQRIRDTGVFHTQLRAAEHAVSLPIIDGPGRLPSSLIRVVVSNLPPDFMTAGEV